MNLCLGCGWAISDSALASLCELCAEDMGIGDEHEIAYLKEQNENANGVYLMLPDQMKPNDSPFPLVHNNGTSAKSLRDVREAVYGALEDSRNLVRECMPNMRDYYPLNCGRDRFDAGTRRVLGWLTRLDEIQKEIEADIAAIDAQVEK